MKAIVFYMTVLLTTALLSLNASAQISSNPIPHKVMNHIYWTIQKRMTLASVNEKASRIWTPKIIELQLLEAESLMPSLYTPQETLFRLEFDVGMGHNMTEAALHWKRCDVAISLIGKNWGSPILNCETFTP